MNIHTSFAPNDPVTREENELKKQSRDRATGIALREGERQAFQIIAEAEGISVSEALYRILSKGAKRYLDDGLLIEPNDPPKGIMHRFLENVANNPNYALARETVIQKEVTRKSLAFKQGDQGPIEFEKSDKT